MRKTKLLALGCLLLATTYGFAQNFGNDSVNDKNTIEALQKTVDLYVQQNMDIEIPEKDKQEILLNSQLEGFTSKETQQQLVEFKKIYLRSRFLKENPSLDYTAILEKGDGSRMAGCLSQGFESLVFGFGLKSGLTVVSCIDNSNLNIGILNTDPNNIPPNAKATIVNSGNDPIVAAAGYTLDRANSGSRALKINQASSVGEGREVDIVSKTFVVDDDIMTFDFATVMEWPTNPHNNNLPYFKYEIFKGASRIVDDCYGVTDTRLTNTTIMTPDRTVFSEWETVTIDLAAYVGDTVTIKFEMADCGLNGHFGYTYIDNIENCGPPAPTCPPNNIFVYDVECRFGAGGDASASWNVNASSVDHITWRYSIGPHSNLPLGTTTGNSSGMHAVNWNLPTPGMPIPGSWDNYNLVVKARAYLTDGTTVCSEFYKIITLNCVGGSGGGQKVTVQPNPTKDRFDIDIEKMDLVSEINVRNIYGTLIKSLKENFSQEIDLSSEFGGIYFIEVKYVDGTSESKKLLLEK